MLKHGVEGVNASLRLLIGGSANVLNAVEARSGVVIGKTVLAVDDLRVERLVCLFDSVVPEVTANCAVYRACALKHPRSVSLETVSPASLRKSSGTSGSADLPATPSGLGCVTQSDRSI